MNTPIIIHWLKLKARVFEQLSKFYDRRADYFEKLAALHALVDNRRMVIVCRRKVNKRLVRAVHFMHKTNVTLIEVCSILQAQVDYEKSRRD